MTSNKVGWLLMNIGTPSEATTKGLRTYFKEFLSDPDVIDTHPILRWAIVNLLVVPFRPRRVLPQYQSVWMAGGSPLLVYSQNFVKKISAMNSNYIFELGMRYGEPSIEQGLLNLQKAKVDKIILAPMFPQYAQATTGSCLRKAIDLIEHHGIEIPYEINDHFYREDFFIDSLAESIENSDSYHNSDFLLFSFHGLPERHIKKMDQSGGYCLTDPNCCLNDSDYNSLCYRHHCYQIVSKVIPKLTTKKPFTVSFQSRFGMDSWIKPNTTDVVESLPAKGITNISVVCPGFIFDCLETLEEIAIRNMEFFVEAGGESMKLIPSLNDSDNWVQRFYTHVNAVSG